MSLTAMSDDEIVAAYKKALTPNTKVILVSHVVHLTGQILPVRAICDMAHERCGSDHRRRPCLRPSELQDSPQANVGLCVEQPAGAILPFLEGYAWITLHAINPLSLQKYPEAFVAHPDRPCRSSRPPSTGRTPCRCEAGVGKDSRV